MPLYVCTFHVIMPLLNEITLKIKQETALSPRLGPVINMHVVSIAGRRTSKQLENLVRATWHLHLVDNRLLGSAFSRLQKYDNGYKMMMTQPFRFFLCLALNRSNLRKRIIDPKFPIYTIEAVLILPLRYQVIRCPFETAASIFQVILRHATLSGEMGLFIQITSISFPPILVHSAAKKMTGDDQCGGIHSRNEWLSKI